jgi:GNAT superfamily N-acetyltransferase
VIDAEVVEVTTSHPSLDEVLSVIRVLREHVSLDELRARFETGAGEGYRLVGVRATDGWKAAAGFHIFTNFINGRILYVDDLVTVADERSRGFGKLLNDFLKGVARRESCATIELDSAVHRHAAHRFYLRERYDIVSHHFSQRLKEDG